jgi:Protein of unknown function (DUF2637)
MTVQANGHAPVLAELEVPRHGPALAWPQERPPRSWPDGDTVIRVLAAVVVLAVAAFAAVVSYNHIFELGRLHGQDGTAARLLPLSVDGLIASASLVMLHAARRELRVPWLARAMLALGVGATVAANVGYGLPFGWLAAVVSAWPAVAFVGSVEMAVRFVRDARQADDTGTPDDDKKDDTKPPPPPPRQRQPRQSGRARAAAILKRHPDWADAKVAEQAGVSERTVQRARSDSHG